MRTARFLILTCILILGASALASSANAQQLSKEAKIKLLITLSRPDAGTTDQIVKQMFAAMRSQPATQIPPEEMAKIQKLQDNLADLIKKNMSPEMLAPVYVPIYD